MACLALRVPADRKAPRATLVRKDCQASPEHQDATDSPEARVSPAHRAHLASLAHKDRWALKAHLVEPDRLAHAVCRAMLDNRVPLVLVETRDASATWGSWDRPVPAVQTDGMARRAA